MVAAPVLSAVEPESVPDAEPDWEPEPPEAVPEGAADRVEVYMLVSLAGTGSATCAL